jgi:hypothetical protein
MKVAICRGKRPKESGLGMKAMPGRSNVFDQRDHDTVLTDLYTYLVIVEQRACGGQALGKRRIGPANTGAVGDNASVPRGGVWQLSAIPRKEVHVPSYIELYSLYTNVVLHQRWEMDDEGCRGDLRIPSHIERW